MPTPISEERRGERRTRWGIVVVGLLIWLIAIAWPGWSLPGLLLGALMVVFAAFGLMVEE